MKNIALVIAIVFLVCLPFLYVLKQNSQYIRSNKEVDKSLKEQCPAIDNSDKTKKIPKKKNIKKELSTVFPFPEELALIRKEAIENNCDGDLFYILLAIRVAEGGRYGLEFGIMHPKAKNTNLEIQAGWAAATVVKNYQRWKNSNSPDDYITFLGKRYCPVGASNDPQGLNANWIRNVKFWYNKLIQTK